MADTLATHTHWWVVGLFFLCIFNGRALQIPFIVFNSKQSGDCAFAQVSQTPIHAHVMFGLLQFNTEFDQIWSHASYFTILSKLSTNLSIVNLFLPEHISSLSEVGGSETLMPGFPGQLIKHAFHQEYFVTPRCSKSSASKCAVDRQRDRGSTWSRKGVC